jgi:asparagine synthase (glutamine-hydrolysing)
MYNYININTYLLFIIMCGIWGYIALTNNYNIQKLFSSFMTVQKRGPDRTKLEIINEFVNIYLGFHRLAIMDRTTYGDQPFTLEVKNDSENRSLYAICNGEIYNYKKLVTENNFILKSGSDCEVLLHLYVKYGFKNMLSMLRGEFALCIIDIDHNNNNIKAHISRDQTAVRPLFVGMDINGIAFSSTLNGLIGLVEYSKIRQVSRGEFYSFNLQPDFTNIISDTYHTLMSTCNINFTDYKLQTIQDTIQNTFTESVIARLESDRPMGALLSGGLDSSLVVSIASEHFRKKGQVLKTFSIGIPGATDKKYAEMVASHCGTEHTHVEFTQQDFLDAIVHVVRATETWDTTTIRASTGQYLVSKWIRQNTSIKVLLIGDGSDELCSGYMYFHNAPTPLDSHNENIRLIEDIQYYDVLRADRCIAYNGLEARVPFLDHNFVDLYLSLPHELRVPIVEKDRGTRKVEKWLLRKSFDKLNSEGVPYLPEDVLWRMKEAFSDGVSSCSKSWYSIIQENVKDRYTEHEFNAEDVSYHIKPFTKESLHFRKLFNELFDYRVAHVVPYYWMPLWSGDIKDPSARVLSVYNNSDI